MIRWLWIIGLFLYHFTPLCAEGSFELPKSKVQPPFVSGNSPWVDSVLNSLDLREKIAQLILIQAYSNKDSKYVEKVKSDVSTYKVGGVIFFQGGPVRQLQLTNQLQSIAQTPLLIGMDAEWGLAMRLDSTIKYPYPVMLGALEDPRDVYEVSSQIATQLKRLGVHLNFAPDADINNNPRNPVINIRSFGEDRMNVTMKSLAFMLGLQDHNIVSVAKHFPGHGDTENDSHYILPVVQHEKNRLDSLELFPFRYLIQAGISGIMSAHINLPRIDSVQNRPASLSPLLLQNILRQEMEFNGLIFTDALNMKAASSFAPPGTIEVQALLAGNDILVMPADVRLAIDSIESAVKNGILSEQIIDEKCRRLLQIKEWVKLNKWLPISQDNLISDLNQRVHHAGNRKIVKKAITLIRNENQLLPLKRMDTLKIAAVVFGDSADDVFGKTLSLYAPVTCFTIARNASADVYDSIYKSLTSFNLLIFTFNSSDIRASRAFGLTPGILTMIDSLSARKKSILCLSASPFSLPLFNLNQNLASVLLGYMDTPEVLDAMAQTVFGGIVPQGVLPVSASDSFKLSTRLHFEGRTRFSFIWPEEIGLNYDSLLLIDSIICEGIEKGAFPASQMFASLNGQVFWYKAYGTPSYFSSDAVSNQHIFDLASITKVTATLPILMQLVDSGRVNIKNKLGEYLPDARKSTKNKLILQDILTHQAGLQAYIPFYTSTMQPLEKGKSLYAKKNSDEYPFRIDKNLYMFRQVGIREEWYRSDSSQVFPTQVAERFWIRNDWKDTMFYRIFQSPLNKKKEYVYSDLGFLMLGKLDEELTGKPLDRLAYERFYKLLGASSLGYKPLSRFPSRQVIPTENDLFWRRQMLRGYVHDQSAAMLGGVAGHAGLFGNSLDLAKLMQMYLNYGIYGGERYIKEETLKTFTSCPYCESGNRRGFGFDKPAQNPEKGNGSPSRLASASSFGHTGFTGTMAWADPQNGLLMVFLSNRIHPAADNTLLMDMNIRTRLHDLLYRTVIPTLNNPVH